MSGIRRWIQRIKDPFPGLSHALGAVMSVAGLVVLLAIGPDPSSHPWLVAGLAVYGVSLVLLYTASALTHSLHCSPRWEWRLDQFDYAAIFLLIAGTYTPVCLGPLRGPWGWGLLAAEWGLAAVGIGTVVLMRRRAGWVRVACYVVMGWLALAAAGPLLRAMPAAALGWLLAGGVLYSVGAIVFATNRPRLWPGRFVAHDLWHCLVLAGSACHFVMVAAFIAPTASAV